VQVVARNMIKRKCHGVIVNVSSMLSHTGIECALAYQVSKGAVDSLTRSMVVQLGPHQVTLMEHSVLYLSGVNGSTSCTNWLTLPNEIQKVLEGSIIFHSYFHEGFFTLYLVHGPNSEPLW